MTFWSTTGAGFKIEVGPFLKFIEEAGFCRLRISKFVRPIIIQIIKNVVRRVTFEEVREYCWNYLLNYQFKEEGSLKTLQEEFVKSRVFQERNVKLIKERTDLNFLRDTKEKAFLLFKNLCIEITRNSVKELKYEEIGGYIWEEQIRPYEYKGFQIINNLKGNFYDFMKDLAPKPPKGNPEDINFNSLKSIIGYLMHNYKDQTNAKAVIFYDSLIDGRPNGRTGKGLLLKGIQKIVETVIEDGKNLKQTSQFEFSQVREGTRLLIIDDAKKGFEFEKLFSAVTENLTVERKFEQRFYIPFELSPKIAITSNYILVGEGASHRSRRIEYALSDTYSDEYSPDVKFGQTFFEDWNEEEWSDFFNVMIHCIQYFLDKGVILPIYNLKLRHLKQEATADFIEFANNNIEPLVRYNKSELYEKFLDSYPRHFRITKNTFTRWVKLAAEAFGFKYNEGHTGSIDYFELSE